MISVPRLVRPLTIALVVSSLAACDKAEKPRAKAEQARAAHTESALEAKPAKGSPAHESPARDSPARGAPAQGEAAAASAGSGGVEFADKGEDPGARLVKPGADVDWNLIKKDVRGHLGKTVICDNLLAPVPLAVDAMSDGAALKMIATPVGDRRTALFCKTKAGGLDSVPVQTYFAKGDKGQLLHIDRDTVANIEIRGRSGNQVVGLFRGIAAAPRKGDHDSTAPDLVAALLWPASHVGETVSCKSKMAVTVQRVAPFDKEAVAMVGVEVAPQKALVRCEDKRGGAVSIEVYFRKGDDRTLLRLGEGTVFTALLEGFARNQLVARFGELKSGAIRAGKDSLKAVLVDPAPSIGKAVSCELLVAPQPREIGAIDGQETAVLKVKLDDRKTALMCAESTGGSVAVSLYFRPGGKRRILAMAARTKVRFSVWGVFHNRLIGLFEKIESGAIQTRDPKDLRAVALAAADFAGKIVPCVVNLAPYVSGLGYMDDAKQKLLRGEQLAGRHAVITCTDATGSVGGTRAEVYFIDKDEAAIDRIARGDTIKLRIKGTAFSTLIALFAGTTAKAGTTP